MHATVVSCPEPLDELVEHDNGRLLGGEHHGAGVPELTDVAFLTPSPVTAGQLEVVGERPRRLPVEVHVGVVEVALEAAEARLRTRTPRRRLRSPADWVNGPVDVQPAAVSRSLNTATAASAAA